MKNVKNFEEYKIIKSSDLLTTATWSPEYHIKKDRKEKPYTKVNGEFVKVDIKKSIPKNTIYLTDENADKYNKLAIEIKKLQEEQEKIVNIKRKNENFDPLLSIENLFDNPLILILLTAWLLKGKYKLDNIKQNIKEMKNDFLDYCVMMGCAIDKDILDYKFELLIDNIKNILKIKK